jgi:hypothetical protein
MTEMQPESTQTPRERYRDVLRTSSIQSQLAYDKTLITLSSGALGVSFLLIKDVLGGAKILEARFALIAWILWAASLLVMLAAFLTGALFLNTAVRKLKDPCVTVESVSRVPNRIQICLNVVGGLLFVAGVVFVGLFGYAKLGGFGG